MLIKSKIMNKINKNDIACVILARGGSKGIPLKNIHLINNHPLISYTIAAAKKSKYINEVFVSTDDNQIASISKLYGAKVPFLRIKKYSTDKTLSVDALKFSVEMLEKIYGKKYRFIIELPCVSPFRDEKDIDFALKKLISSKYDSVVSYVNTGEKHPIRMKRIKRNNILNFCKEYPEPKKGSRRQDFEPCFIRNGAIYAMTRDCLFKKKSREGNKSFPFVMSENKSINIDNKFDLLVAKKLIESGHCNNIPQKINNRPLYSNEKIKNYDILITARLFFNKEILNKFMDRFNCIYLDTTDKNLIKKHVKKAKIWLCSPTPKYKINKDILKECKNLKLIITPSTGTTHIDLKYCRRSNIIVRNLLKTRIIKKIYASSEFTFSLFLTLFKNIPKALKTVLSGHWRNEEDRLRANEIFGKKVLILGYGRIGKNLNKYCKIFGMNVKIFDPYKINRGLNILRNKEQLYKNLRTTDVVFVCINYTKENKSFVSKKFLNHMKQGAILINTSRGEVICEDSLISALKSKKIGKAAVDVVSNEQSEISKNKLIKFAKSNENLIITPHIAGLTYESESKAAMQSLKTLIEYEGELF